MAILTSKTELGGVVGDTFTDALGKEFELLRVDADGEYVWREISGGGGDNYFNADLTADKSVTHDGAEFSVSVNDVRSFVHTTDGSTAGRFEAIHNGPSGEISNVFVSNARASLSYTGFGRKGEFYSSPQQAKVSYDNVSFGFQRVGADNELRIATDDVVDSVATNGQVLTLIDATTGHAEWQAAGGGNNLATSNLVQTDTNRTYDFGTTGAQSLNFIGQAAVGTAFNASADAVNLNGGTSSLSIGNDGVAMAMFGPTDLQINGNPGVASQVLTSNGPNTAPTWQAAGGSNLFDADDTLAAGQNRNHTVDGSFGMSGAGSFSVNMQGSNPFIVGFTADALINNASMCASGSTGNNCVEASGTGIQIMGTDGLDFFIPGGLRLSGNTGLVGQQLTCQGASSPIWGAASDERVKESIADIKDAGIIVDNLRPVTFSYKQDGNKSAGFIAQEVEEILPNLVDKQKVEEIEDFRTLDYNGIFAIAVKALQDTRAEVASLKARIEKLES